MFSFLDHLCGFTAHFTIILSILIASTLMWKNDLFIKIGNRRLNNFVNKYRVHISYIFTGFMLQCFISNMPYILSNEQKYLHIGFKVKTKIVLTYGVNIVFALARPLPINMIKYSNFKLCFSLLSYLGFLLFIFNEMFFNIIELLICFVFIFTFFVSYADKRNDFNSNEKGGGITYTLFGLEAGSFQSIGQGLFITTFWTLNDYFKLSPINSTICSFIMGMMLFGVTSTYNNNNIVINSKEKKTNSSNSKTTSTILFVFFLLLSFLSIIGEGFFDRVASDTKNDISKTDENRSKFRLLSGWSRIIAPLIILLMNYIAKKKTVIVVLLSYIISQLFRNYVVHYLINDYYISDKSIFGASLMEPIGSSMYKDLLLSTFKYSFNPNQYNIIETVSGFGKFIGISACDLVKTLNVEYIEIVFILLTFLGPIIVFTLAKKKNIKLD